MKCFVSICIMLLLLAGTAWTLEPNDSALVGLWLCDDGSGDVVKDTSGNKNDGKFSGAFKWEDGKFGKCVVASGGGSIDVQTTDSINSITDALTIAAWFRVDAVSDTGIRRQNAYLLEDQSTSEAVPDGFSFRVWTTQGLSPGLYGKTELEHGEWYHIAGTYDGENVEMYVNGEPESEQGALNDGGADWKPQWDGKVGTPGDILQLKYGSETYNGGIDEIVLFNRALEADEIKQLLNGWADAFPVHAQGKTAVTWGEIKAQD